MTNRKKTYKTSLNKKKVREFLFDKFAPKKFTKIVGLPGPDPEDYINFCKSKGYKEFEMYENHFPTIIEQIKFFRTKAKISLIYGNVFVANPNRQDVLYDLDYCCTTKHLCSDIRKFNTNFIMTFSRRISDKKTFETFFKAKGEMLYSVFTLFSPIKHSILTTENGNKYYYVDYYDTSSMCCFAKIN